MILSREQMADHRDEVKWVPLSLVITAGTPNLEIHPWNMVEAHSAAEIPVRGIASDHLVDLSMHVKRYVKPLDEGKGPTSCMHMCKPSEGYRNLFRANVNMAEDLTSLALQAGLAPVTDVVG